MTQREQMKLEKWYQQTCSTQGCHKTSICKEHMPVKCSKAEGSKKTLTSTEQINRRL